MCTTLWPFQVGVPTVGTAILGFSQSAVFSKGWVCGGGVRVVFSWCRLYLNRSFVTVTQEILLIALGAVSGMCSFKIVC